MWVYAGFNVGLCGSMPALLWVYAGFIGGSMAGLLWVYGGLIVGLCWVYASFNMTLRRVYHRV